MSSVDNRLVKMTFDNESFEKNVSTTLGTLDKLKQSLNFTGATKGLDDIQSSVNGLNFGALVSGIEELQSRFSVLGEFTHNILEGILTKITDVGKSLAEAAIITPIKDGFSEYELQMNSVQTIMASTGESVETVNGYLDELNKYADKTIYSFSDMTQNIGKFTNAGVSLDRAVEAIQGVSNVAAVSGANTNEASRAMYNFAQALSAGAVKLIDWKSIENANMATVEFKQSLIDTAVAMGTLVKDGDNYVSTTTDIRGKTSDAFNATKMFNESLSSQWMTTDVLVQTLSQYSTDVREMGDDERAAYEEKLRSIGYTEDQIAAIEELGIKAADSAKDVKTFTQLIDTLKEALGSGWTKSWQYIIGDLEEAKALWTEVSETLGGYINQTADARNDTLRIWAENGGRVAVIDSLRNAFEALVSVLTPIKEAWDSVFPPVTAEILIDYSNRLKTFTESLKLTSDESKSLKDIMTSLFSGIKNVGETLFNIFKVIADGMKNAFGNTYVSKIGEVASRFRDFTEAIKPNVENLEKFKMIVEGVTSVLRAIIYVAINAGTALFDALGNVFMTLAPHGQKFLDMLAQVGEWLKSFANALETSFSFETFSNGFGSMAEAVKYFLEQLAAFTHIDDIIDNIKAFFTISEGHEHSFDFLNTIGEAFKHAFEVLNKYSGGILSKIKEFVSQIDFTKIDFFDLLEKALSVGLIKKVWDLLSALYKRFTEGSKELPGLLTDIKNTIKKFTEGVVENLKTITESLTESFSAIQNTLNANALLKIAIAIGILVASLTVLSNLDPTALAGAMAALAGVMVELGAFIKVMDAIDVKNSKALGKIGTAMVEMAGAVLILAKAVKDLAQLDSESLGRGLFAITTLIADMTAAVTVLNNTKFVDSPENLKKMGLALVEFAAAVKILASCVKDLGEIPADRLIPAMQAVSAIIIELGAVTIVLGNSKFVNKPGNLKQMGLALIEFAAAVKIIVSSTKDLGEIPADRLIPAMQAVSAIMGELGAVTVVLGNSKFVNKPGNLKQIGLALIEFAAAVKIIVSSTKDLGEIPADRLIPAMQAVSVIIGELGAVTVVLGNSKFVNKPGNLKQIGLALVEFAAAVKIIVSSTKDLGEVPADRLIPAMEAVSAIIIELGAVTVVLGNSKFIDKPGNLKKIGLGLIEFAAVVKIIASVVKDFSEIESDKLGTSVGALTILMVELGAIAAAFSADILNPGKIAAVSAALIVFSVAMGAMALVMLTLSTMDLPGIGIALAAIGGAILIFAAAAALLEPLVVPMYSLAGAMLVFGAGLALVGVGIGVASIGIATLLGTIVGLGPGAIDVLRQFIGLMGELGVGFGNMIVGLLTTLAENGPTIQESIRQLFEIMITAIAESTTFLVETILQVVLQIVTSLNETLPQIVELVLTLISSILTSIAEHLPEIMEAVMSIIITILTTIAEHIQEIVQAGIDIVLGFIAGITEKLPEIIDAAFKMIISFIDGLATAIEENHQALFEAIGHLIQAIVEAIIDGIVMLVSAAGDLIGAFIEAVGGFFNDIFSKGGELVGGLIDGFLDGLGGIAQAGVDLIGSLLESIGDFLSDLWDSGSDLVGNLIDGLLDGLRDIGDAAGDLGDELLDGINGFWSDIWDAGSDLVEGFIDGLTSGISDVWNAACDLANEAWNAITSTLEINSPSRVAYGGGQNVDQGFINGMTSMIPDVKNASAATAYAAIASFDDTCSQLNDTEYTPTITPVIDSMEIQNGMIENFEARISFPDSVSIKSKLDERLDFDQKIYNMLEVENDNILRSMSEISTRIDLFQERLLDMGIYIDGQALVGAIAPDMDNALGQRSTYAQRGIFG